MLLPSKERVTEVIDGDTFETASRKRPGRLAGVDAPEKRKRVAARARERLKNLIQVKRSESTLSPAISTGVPSLASMLATSQLIRKCAAIGASSLSPFWKPPSF